jgi:hypothetical protein
MDFFKIRITWVWVNTYRYIFSGMNIHFNPAMTWGSLGTRVLTHPHLLVIKHRRLKNPPADEIRGAIHVIAITCTDPQRDNGVRASGKSPFCPNAKMLQLQLILFFVYIYI